MSQHCSSACHVISIRRVVYFMLAPELNDDSPCARVARSMRGPHAARAPRGKRRGAGVCANATVHAVAWPVAGCCSSRGLVRRSIDALTWAVNRPCTGPPQPGNWASFASNSKLERQVGWHHDGTWLHPPIYSGARSSGAIMHACFRQRAFCTAPPCRQG
jgi:hypothetical protein